MADSSRPGRSSGSRSRSRSPPRRTKPSSSGFRWKDERRRTDDRRRDRSPRRNRSRSRDRFRNRETDDDRERKTDRDDGRSARREEGERERDRDRDRDRDGDQGREDRKPKKEKSGKKASKAKTTAPTQPMIIVNINSRLGTKTAIPCLPSDTIYNLKALIAAQIGRQTSQIRLQRQGERPFKDQLSLEDYGISNGVQLDLEVDTRD